MKKVVLVTGAAGGIGRGIGARLAHDPRVGSVVLADLDPAAVAATAGGLDGGAAEIVPLALDVADEDSRRAAVEACTHRFGGVDVLVNCAGSAA